MTAPAPEFVGPREIITRFLRNSSHFVASKNRVLHEGLLPPPLKDGRARHEISVYRTDGLTPAQVWTICADYVDRPPTLMKARATVTANAYMQRGLVFDPDGKPHPRHANIIQWPAEKHAQKSLAIALANEMALEVRPNG